jgi:uncharacterized protein
LKFERTTPLPLNVEYINPFHAIVRSSTETNAEIRANGIVRANYERRALNLTRDPVSAVTIRHVESGRICIGDEQFEQSIVLSADENIRSWTATDIGELMIEDFEELLTTEPDVVILGTGWQASFVPRELTFAMARRGIGFEVMDTPAACRTFNILLAEGRRPAAILIIT